LLSGKLLNTSCSNWTCNVSVNFAIQTLSLYCCGKNKGYAAFNLGRSSVEAAANSLSKRINSISIGIFSISFSRSVDLLHEKIKNVRKKNKRYFPIEKGLFIF